MANQNFKVKKGLEVGTGVTISDGGVNITGVITAAQFNGDGSGLTGVTAAGSGVVIQEEGSSVGTAATINFIGSNVTAAISGGVASVTVAGGSSDVVSDTTPQLGGNLDLNSKDITGTGNISITGGFNATGVSTFQESVTFQSHASFGDDDKANFGAGDDLQIYHQSSNNSGYIKESGSGNLYIQGSNLYLTDEDGTNMLYAANNAGVSLYYGGGKEFETTGVGVTVFGTTQTQQLNVSGISTLGSLKVDGTTIESSGQINLATNGSAFTLDINTTDAIIAGGQGASQYVQLYGAGSEKIRTAGYGVTVTGTAFSNQLNVSGVSTFQGNINLGDNDQLRFGAGNDLKIYHDSADSAITNDTGRLFIRNNTDDEDILLQTDDGSGGVTSYLRCDGSEGSVKIYYYGSSKIVTTNHGAIITGVATATSFSGSGSSLTGLTGASAGTFGASNATPIITVDSNGRITGIATVATAGAGGGGGISNIVEDTTPQLGGNLDLNSKDITGSGDLDYTGNLKVTGISTITGVAGFSSHVTLPDHAEIQVGNATGGDLKIYHDGSNSYVAENGTGVLYLQGTQVVLRKADGSEDLAKFIENGAVQLYHNNALRLQTSGTGVNITDDLNVAGIATANSFVKSSGTSSEFLKADGSTDNSTYLTAETDPVVAAINGLVKSNGTTISAATAGTDYLTPTGDGSSLTGIAVTAVSNTQVTYNFGASGLNYVITGPGYSNTVNNPDLYLVRGQRYRFINATGTSHPLRIQSDTSGTAYTDGVSGSQSGTQEFNVQHDAPSRLFYQCTIHSGMIGNIYITGGANWQMADVAETASAEIYTLNNVGIGTDNPGERLHLTTTSGNCKLRIDAASAASVDFYNSGTRFSDMFTDASTGNFTITNRQDADIIVRTNGTNERLRVTSAGLVGIGTDNPRNSAKLDVHNSTSSGAYINYDGRSNTEYGLRIESNAAGGNFESDFSNGTTALLDLFANSSTVTGGDLLVARTQSSTPVLLVRGNGNIGINSTTPHRQLVVGDGGDISCFGPNGGIYFGTSTGGFRNNGAIARAQQAGFHVSTSQVGDLVMAPEADKDLIFSSGSTNTMVERLRLTTGGNIGINDSGPNFHLDVNGNIALREGQVLTWHDGSGNKAGDIYMDSSDNFVIRNTSSVAERLRITSAGLVGIGTNNPSGKLNIAGSDSQLLNLIQDSGDLAIRLNDRGAGSAYIKVPDNTSGSLAFETGGSERLRIDSNGKLSTGGETSPDVSAGGLCLDQNAEDGIILSFKSSDINHGITTLDETDTYFSVRKVSGDKGGTRIRAYTDAAGGDPAVLVTAYINSDTDQSYVPITLLGGKKDGTGTQNISANRRIVEFKNANGTRIASFTGTGLTFGNDSDAANALNDYEEGTFTPSWKATGTNYSSVTYSSQSGKYTKIGNQVFVSLRLISSGYTGSPSGNLLVDGLPFTINDANGSGGGSPSTFHIDYVDGVVNVAVEFRNNTDEIYLLASQDNGAWANVGASGIRSSATSEIRVSFFYTTDS